MVFWLDVSFLPGYLSRRLDCLTLIVVNMGIVFYRVAVQREESPADSPLSSVFQINGVVANDIISCLRTAVD